MLVDWGEGIALVPMTIVGPSRLLLLRTAEEDVKEEEGEMRCCGFLADRAAPLLPLVLKFLVMLLEIEAAELVNSRSCFIDDEDGRRLEE